MSTPTIPTVEEIYERVSSLPEGCVVGFCGSPSDCIIGMHMKAQHPELEFSVQCGNRLIEWGPQGADAFYSEETAGAPMPEALWRMARGFDQMGAYSHKVTAREARLYLHGFLRATKESWT